MGSVGAAGVREAIVNTVREHSAALVETFYRSMLDDPEAAPFLSVQAVEERLKPGLARWLEQLLCFETEAELLAALALQRHVGEVHARAEIPVRLVARGMRLLKYEIGQRIAGLGLSREDTVLAILRVGDLMDLAFEEMSAVFVQSHENGVRVDEAYRMFAVGHHPALEREKQIGALLDWENRLFRMLATEGSVTDLPSIHDSGFGLWLHHKASLIFKDTQELASIDACVRRIDETLIPEALAAGAPLDAGELRALVRAVIGQLEQIRYLLASMFERLTDLEVGRDVLTQLLNRRFLPTVLKREIELNRRHRNPFCLLMVDVDHFKQINDGYGHDAGDRVLQAVAGLLAGQVRASDFVFRYGGEEFLMVLAEIDLAQAVAVADKICRHVEAAEIPVTDERRVKVTVSVGVADYDGHPDYQRLVDRADAALYDAKRGGRNRYVIAAGGARATPQIQTIG